MSIHKYRTAKDKTRFRVAWRDHTGRQCSKSFKSLAEAKVYDAEVRLGRNYVPSKKSSKGVTVDDWMVKWFRGYSREWAATTTIQRKQLIDKWIHPMIGDQPIASFTRGRVRELRNELIEAGATDKTVNKILSVLSAMFTAAVDEELLENNPCFRVKRLRVEPTRRRALTPTEVEEIRYQMPTARDQLAVSLMAYAGLRPAEMCGLQWGHITDSTLQIRQSVQLGEVVHTKTKRGRTVPICEALAADLQSMERGLDDDFVIAGERIATLDFRNWRNRVWRPAIKAAGIQASPYDLRHTYASLLIHAGETVAVVAANIGHANPNLTLSVYTHAFTEAQLAKRVPMDDAIRDARTQTAANHRRAASSASQS